MKTHLALAGAVPSRQQRSPRRCRRRVGPSIRVDSVAVGGPVSVAVEAVVGVERRLLDRRRALLGERGALAARAGGRVGSSSLRRRRRRILGPAATRRDAGDELAQARQAPIDLLQSVQQEHQAQDVAQHEAGDPEVQERAHFCSQVEEERGGESGGGGKLMLSLACWLLPFRRSFTPRRPAVQRGTSVRELNVFCCLSPD